MSYRFGDFEIDPLAGLLTRSGQPLELPRRVFDCLVCLIERQPGAVSRDALIQQVWGRANVSDNQLAKTILRLRRALGDSGEAPRHIGTVPGYGYRWLAPLQPAADPPEHIAIDSPSPAAIDQTLDAVRVTARPMKGASVDYFYAWRVNRVFGPDSPLGIWRDTEIHGVRAAYTIKNVGTLSAYGYWLDVPSSPASSNRTLGVRMAGELPVGGKASILYSAEYARQHDHGANPRSFGLDYWLFEPGVKAGPVTLKAGYERLEGNGTVGLQTPLATLHAFNGWADKFLTTPASGLRDVYLDAGYKVPGKGPLAGLVLRAVWHDYGSTTGGIAYGQEWNALASYPLGKRFTLTAKLAHYDADAFASDTTKLWFQIEAKF